MADRLRIGVVGLGRRWARHYRPALAALGDRFVIRAVTDPCPQRAAAAGREVGCPAAPGVLELLDGDLDAVLLLDRTWYRLWPLEQACRLGRPVYLGRSLASDDARADGLVQQVRVANLPVMAELLPRLAPVTGWLHRQLPKLGSLRSVICLAEQPSGSSQANLAVGLALMDWCGRFFDRAPVFIQAVGNGGAGHAGWIVDFGGPVARIVIWPGRRRIVRVRLIGERGSADAIFPRRIRWKTGGTCHTVKLPLRRPLVRQALEQFHSALTAGRPPAPNLDDAYLALTRLRAARRGEW